MGNVTLKVVGLTVLWFAVCSFSPIIAVFAAPALVYGINRVEKAERQRNVN